MTLPPTPRDYNGNGDRYKGEHQEYEDARLHARPNRIPPRWEGP
jgi:hypothetical protein